MPVQNGSTTPPRREAFSWAIYKACCWYMALYMLTSRHLRFREPQDWGKGLIDLQPAFFDAELTRFISTNLLLSLYMVLTIGKLLGCLTSRQSEQLQFNLFLHYTFKYVLMRLLLPSNIEGLYTWLAW
ncbi:hypothetical protein DUNSADRAFT_11560 [Dunaliella salina]|uniref:Uncharacterized protein n=1 Tax=Dunaliella salina TaxID=3046 RepID=A0ABQ7GD29_DUNSA|nr:hypothetical protein DUNSADRAFT_11560 [Dunaliella salina]|eukprot:KAF5832522.1 hypothetical protein DUNSADRAFT_11560 [Dunaliella salina]